MEKLIINGGNRLKGEVTISGAKNAAVAIIPACLLINGICRLENLPNIKDVKLYLEILSSLGASVEYVDENTVDIDCTNVSSHTPNEAMTMKMRGSMYLVGALLARCGKCIIPPPGGCDFGTRPIDQHIKGFEAIGAKVEISEGYVSAEAQNGIIGNSVYFGDNLCLGNAFCIQG